MDTPEASYGPTGDPRVRRRKTLSLRRPGLFLVVMVLSTGIAAAPVPLQLSLPPALANGTCGTSADWFTGSQTSVGLSSEVVTISTQTPTVCPYFDDNSYWGGIAGTPSGEGFSQDGWLIEGAGKHTSPTAFWEVFYLNGQTPGPIYGSLVQPGSANAWEVKILPGPVCGGGYSYISYYYENGSLIGAECQDWASGTLDELYVEVQDKGNHIGTQVFGNAKSCLASPGNSCDPGAAVTVQSSDPGNSDPYTCYLDISQSEFEVYDKSGSSC